MASALLNNATQPIESGPEGQLVNILASQFKLSIKYTYTFLLTLF